MKPQDVIELELTKELIRWGTPEESLTQRTVTKDELLAMGSKEYLWHSRYNSKHVEAALAKPKLQVASKAEAARLKTLGFWKESRESTVMTDEMVEMLEAVEEFCTRFPQLDSKVESNRTQITALIEQRNQLITADTLRQSFETLASQGKLYLTPSEIGLEGDESINGRMLTSRPDFHKFLLPKVELTEADKIRNMSSDEYKAAYPDEFRKPAPYMVKMDARANYDTFVNKHKDYVFDEDSAELLINYILQNELPQAPVSSWEAAFDGVGHDKFVLKSDIAIEPVHVQQVEIRELPRRWTRQQILSMSSADYQMNREKYPDFDSAVDEAFN